MLWFVYRNVYFIPKFYYYRSNFTDQCVLHLVWIYITVFLEREETEKSVKTVQLIEKECMDSKNSPAKEAKDLLVSIKYD